MTSHLKRFRSRTFHKLRQMLYRYWCFINNKIIYGIPQCGDLWKGFKTPIKKWRLTLTNINLTVSTIGGGSEPFEGLWFVSCLSPMEFWGTKMSLFYGQSQWGRDDRGLHWRKFINKILLFPLKIPTPLLGVIKLICRFSSTSVPSAERRLCRYYFSIYSCTHENKIVWKWSVSSHKIK